MSIVDTFRMIYVGFLSALAAKKLRSDWGPIPAAAARLTSQIVDRLESNPRGSVRVQGGPTSFQFHPTAQPDAGPSTGKDSTYQGNAPRPIPPAVVIVTIDGVAKRLTISAKRDDKTNLQGTLVREAPSTIAAALGGELMSGDYGDRAMLVFEGKESVEIRGGEIKGADGKTYEDERGLYALGLNIVQGTARRISDEEATAAAIIAAADIAIDDTQDASPLMAEDTRKRTEDAIRNACDALEHDAWEELRSVFDQSAP